MPCLSGPCRSLDRAGRAIEASLTQGPVSPPPPTDVFAAAVDKKMRNDDCAAEMWYSSRTGRESVFYRPI